MTETFYTMDLPVSAAVVSDLHAGAYGAVLASLQRNRPGIICIPGDLFHACRPTDSVPVCLTFPGVLAFLRACALTAPCFLSLGNHEWMLSAKDFSLIRSTGVTVLDNSWVFSGGLCVGGLTSAYVARFRECYSAGGYVPKRTLRKRDEPVPELDWLTEFEAQPGFRILLSHHPEYRKKYLMDRRIDLIVSGHAHGGQIRLFRRGLFAPGQGLLPECTSGIHGNMVVSRGLANTAGAIPRLFNPPELVYIR